MAAMSKSMPPLKPLARQLVWGGGSLLFAIGSVTLGLNYVLSQRSLDELAEQRAQTISQGLEFATEGLLDQDDHGVLRRVVQNYATLPAVEEVTIVSPQKRVIATSTPWPDRRSLFEEQVQIQTWAERAMGSGKEVTVRPNASLLVKILPFSSALFEPGSRRGLAIIVLDMQEMQQIPLMILYRLGALFFLGAGLALGSMAWGLHRWVLHPLAQLQQAIAHSTEKNYPLYLSPFPPNEIGFLADTFAQVFKARLDSEEEARVQAVILKNAIQELQQTQAQLWETERLAQLNRALQESEERYRAIVNQTTEGIILLDRQTLGICEVNPAYCNLTGYGAETLMTQKLTDLVNISPEQLMAELHYIASLEYERCLECQHRDRRGNWLDVEIHFSPIVYSGQAVFCCAIRDITERKQIAARLAYEATHDPLTQLPNRNFFHQQLTQALEQAAQGGHQLGVFFLDLDRFKVVNDTLGHPVGDRLLQSFAARIQEGLDAQAILARWGGDEFTLLLPQLSALQDGQTLAEQIQELLRHPFLLEGQEFYITSSLGIAIYPEDGADAATLLKHADTALYRAKEDGRNRYQFYSRSFDRHSSELLRLETALYHALDRQELFLCYQPLIDVANRSVYGVEALIRWAHPELGLVSPAQFIPLAEETGLINRIGVWVMETACAQAKTWQDQGLPPMRIALNLSPRQLHQQPIVTLVRQTLEKTGLAPQWLELEITESSLMRDLAVAERYLLELGQLGVHVAMDDFGTGYSSLSYFRQFAFDTIKIDQSFVRHVEQDPLNLAIIHALVDLVRHTGRHLVIEGIETPSQMDLLRQTGCDIMQGYLFCRPLKAADLTEQLRAWDRLGGVPLPDRHPQITNVTTRPN